MDPLIFAYAAQEFVRQYWPHAVVLAMCVLLLVL